MLELASILLVSLAGAGWQCSQIYIHGLTASQKYIVNSASGFVFTCIIFTLVALWSGSWELSAAEWVVFLSQLPALLALGCTFVFLWLSPDKKSLAYITTTAVWMLPSITTIKSSAEFLPIVIPDPGLTLFAVGLTAVYVVAMYASRNE